MRAPIDRWKAAIEQCDVDAVRDLFEQNRELVAEVNSKVFAFDSAAIFVCRHNIEMVDLLLHHGADINSKTGWAAGGFGILEGIEPELAGPLIERGAIVDIWAAVSLDKMDRVQALLNDAPHLITAGGGDGVHPLHYARSVEMIDVLVARGADVNARCTDHGSTPIQYLVQHEDLVQRLLAHGAKPDIFMAAYWGDASIIDACHKTDPECCNVRLGAGDWTHDGNGDIYKWKIGHDFTPVDAARSQGHSKAVDLILTLSSPAARLSDAIWQADDATAKAIDNSDPATLARLIEEDPAAMCRAAWENKIEVVALMLGLGFDPHRTGVHDSSPLDRAAFHGYAEVVELLLHRDPKPPLHKQNEFGGTPLSACLFGMAHGWDTGHERDHVETTRLLIEAGSAVSENMLGAGTSETDAMIKEKL